MSALAITPETQAKIDAAFADKASAEEADVAHNQADLDLMKAQQADDAAQAASLEAHKKAADSAHVALAALAAELGIPLPA